MDPSSFEASTPESSEKKLGKGLKSRVAKFQHWISNGKRSRGSSASSEASMDSFDKRETHMEDRSLTIGTPINPSRQSAARSSMRDFLGSYPQSSSSNWSDTRERPLSASYSHFAVPSTQQLLQHLAERPADSASPADSDMQTELSSSNNSLLSSQRMSAVGSDGGNEKENLHGLRMLERNVDEYMDAKSGSDESSSIGTYIDEEGVKVRKIKIFSHQNVGFESLPVQFVNKATKSGFVFNILVIGETGVGKSTLINSLFNYDFKLPPGDHQLESVALDKHTFQLEEGSVRMQLTIIETKGYGDQLNMSESWQGIVEYIDKQYEAYFQEESQVFRRLSDYKDTRIHVCLFLLAPTGSTVRALDLECMKHLGNKVNIIPVIARGDSLTKKEMDSFKRRIVDELRVHKINTYKFPEDDPQVADLNRKMNADVPFAVVGSSEVCDVAGHKTRARVYPWGTVDIENEIHCDFSRFREALLRVNMDDLMQATNLQHYEVYRDRRMKELGYGDNDNHSFIETITRLHQGNEQKYRQKEEETRTSFVNKVREKETELKERERELHSQFEGRRGDFGDRMSDIEAQRAALQKEMEIFNRVKSELINHPAGTIKPKKK